MLSWIHIIFVSKVLWPNRNTASFREAGMKYFMLTSLFLLYILLMSLCATISMKTANFESQKIVITNVRNQL